MCRSFLDTSALLVIIQGMHGGRQESHDTNLFLPIPRSSYLEDIRDKKCIPYGMPSHKVGVGWGGDVT